MSSFRRKGGGGGQKRNFYEKRAAATAKKLGISQPYNKRNPNNYGNDNADNDNNNGFDLGSKQTTKQRLKERLQRKVQIDAEDEDFGFARYKTGPVRLGWLLNITPTIVVHSESGAEQSALDLYFLQENGDTFKSSVVFYPYFYVLCEEHYGHRMEQFLQQKLEGMVHQIELVRKIDLDQKNHLSGIDRQYIKLVFLNESDLRSASRQIQQKITANAQKRLTKQVYGDAFMRAQPQQHASHAHTDLMAEITDIREYDVDYVTRCCIDLNIRVANWFDVLPVAELNGCCRVTHRSDIEHRPEAKIFAFDIETEKAPLKFPNAEHDRIMMISYMIDTEGFLIVNRDIVSSDIDDFEYTPKAEYPGVFTIFNEDNEEMLLRRFFEHIVEQRPHVYVHYNGDFFDWPYIEKRAFHFGISMRKEIGISKDRNDIYVGRFVINIDCYSWVSRDSYLPQGSQNLKEVTRKKLQYNPVELDPELMVEYAYRRPSELATYSVSDAVATYYLFKKYVQDFIFSLCQIIPLNAGDVLRKGTGTLCEALLMVQAYERNLIAPNKQRERGLKFYQGHVLESETYIGGTVEAFESGVFRCDLPCKFKVDADAVDELVRQVPDTVRFFVEVEKKRRLDEVENASQVIADICAELEALKANDGYLVTPPLIYHLDVAAMYPNIILTNRLQPVAVVNDEVCASCDYNRPGKQCQRFLPWRWRGKYYPANKGEFNQVRAQIEYETFDRKSVPNHTWSQKNRLQQNEAYKFSFSELSEEQQQHLLTARIKDYSQKVYKRQSESKEEERQSVICQRENGFYVDTVRSFRDRRYYYKGLTRTWKQKQKSADNNIDRVHCHKMSVMYDSIQLAHKCILNSFYGYVMRRGSRWYSMDMAAITTHIGGNIIRDAHKLCNRIGRPLELDTDGIWTLLPSGFPENFHLKLKNDEGKGMVLEYPGSMLNLRTHHNYTNAQYHESSSATQMIRSECSIFFEVDGPYRCMVLPASTEEGRKLKKRYAVFNHDGSLAELKGFEIKRRGELQMIKIFQQEVFKTFLKGSTLHEVYDKVAEVGKRWLDILDTRAAELTDSDLFEYITESKNMSKTMEEYGDAKSLSITCAKRLASFLGDAIGDTSGLCCKFIISEKPIGEPVSQRAVPVAIFQAERPIMKQYLKKWMKDNTLVDFDIRSIVDWAYYRKRIGANIQKIVTIPAAMQKIVNPLPNLQHPAWLFKKISQQNDPFQQRKITSFFNANQAVAKKVRSKPTPAQSQQMSTQFGGGRAGMDIEDIGKPSMVLMSAQKQRRRTQNATLSLVSMKDTLLMEESMLNDSELQDSELQDSELQDSELQPQAQQQQENAGDAHNRRVQAAASPSVQVSADFDDDFDVWLRQSKTLWSHQTASKKRLKQKKRKRSGGLNNDDGGDDNDDNQDGDAKRRKVKSGDGYFRLQQRLDELYSHAWQIIQIVQLDAAGKYALWIYVNHRVRRVKLQVKRPFYININDVQSFPRLESRGKLVSRVLPRSRPVLSLLELQLKEDDFQAQSKEISMFLTHPDVEGVYETNVPLLFRIVSNLGCCSAVSRFTKMQNTHSTLGFSLDELEFRSTTQQSYCEGPKFEMLRLAQEEAQIARDTMKYVYFYHSTANNSNTNNDQRSIFSFVYQKKHEETHQFHCHVIAVNPHKNRKLWIASSSLEEQAQQFIANYQLTHYDNVEIKVRETQTRTIAQAYVECNKFLDQYRMLLNGPTIILSQTAADLSDLYHKIPLLCEHFPVIPFHFNALNNRYPALQWYKFATQHMLQNWLVIPTQLHTKQSFARYSHIPIGNMPDDIWSFTSDVFLSRLLSDNKHLWWISDGSRPDLGGLEEDENLYDDEHENPVINAPGAYHTFCIELELFHLATNTVLQSEHIQTLELGAGGDANAGDLAMIDHKVQDERKENFHKSNLRMDDTTSCMASFKIVKKLVQNWCNDVMRGAEKSDYADRLLMEFYRWLRTPSSLFYDPLLHRMIHRLMKKVFMQLIAQFRQFGATIIYASFNRIILETGKNQIENAVGYVDSCLNSIAKNHLFEFLTISPSNFWECMVWYDHANFGGFLLQPKESKAASNTAIAATAAEDRFKFENFERELEVRWNMASFLPAYAEDIFDVVFATFLTDVRNEYRRLLGMDVHDNDDEQPKPIKLKSRKKKQILRRSQKNRDKREMDEVSSDSDLDVDDSGDDDLALDEDNDENLFSDAEHDADVAPAASITKPVHNALLASEIAAKFCAFKQRMIDNQISPKVFEYVKQILHKVPRHKADVFPIRPGSHLTLTDPALEFIKYLCCVLSLDADISDQINVLRKNLLRMVEVGEFNKAAKFVNPCMTYILPDVNCFHCKQSRDLDLCRDPFTKPLCLTNEFEEVERGNDTQHEWNVKCNGCGQLYDQDLVESMLLDVVRRRETAYHVQDVVCRSCGQAKLDDMSEYCSCSGQFKNKLSRQQFLQNMEIFYNIAQHYQFVFLQDTVDWITRDANH